MQKKTFWKYVAIISIFSCLIINWGNVAIADNGEETAGIVSSGETPLIPIDEGSDGSADVTPLDITYGDSTWYILQTSATVYYAPYGTGCASTGYTLSAGEGVFLQGREYDYFYVCFYVGQKEMYGYIPMSAISPSNYVWIQYDIYRPGTCTGSTPVRAGAGSSNTYIEYDALAAGEPALLILGQQVNPYNNVPYYFVQYLNSAGLVMRGWVDSSLGTVTINNVSSPAAYHITNEFIIRNRSTDRVLGWNPTTNQIEQQTMSGSIYQYFKFERTRFNGVYNGYFKIVPAENANMAFRVSSTGFANGLSIYMATKGEIDKREEFFIELGDYIATEKATYIRIATRSSGHYRYFEANGTYNVIQNVASALPSQEWEIIPISATWDRGYENANQSGHPGNFQIKVDDSVLNYLSLSDIQSCINRWNYADNSFNIQVVAGSGFSLNTLAIISTTNFDLYGSGFSTALGVTCPVLSSSADYLSPNMSPSSTQLNASWYTTQLLIDFYRLEDYHSRLSVEQQQQTSLTDVFMSTIVHELGHSLKMTHTFLYYNKNTTLWESKNYSISVMNPNKDESSNNGYLQGIDSRRFLQKWSSY